MGRENISSDFDSIHLLGFVYKWRKPFIIVMFAAAIVSAAASFLIEERYRSEMILFPVSTNSISKALLSDDQGSSQDILKFGEEEEAEQMLQILHSDEIRNRIIEKYDLLRHYEIDPASPYPLTRLHKRYEENITFKRTEFMSVKISVLDKDPKIAADIANDIAALSDSTRNKIQRDRALKGLQIIEKELHKKQQEIKEIEDSLAVLRVLGIYDYHAQTEILTEQLSQAMIKGKVDVVKSIREQLDILKQYGGGHLKYTERLWQELKQLDKIKEKYQQARVDVDEVMPHKFVVNKAVSSEKKAYPIRWLVVLMGTLSALLICLLVIISIEKIKTVRQMLAS